MTNKSDQAYTVGRFVLELGRERALENEPVARITYPSEARTQPIIETHRDAYYFEESPLERPQAFPDMAYLLPGQSKAGAVLFPLPDSGVGAVEKALLRLRVSGYDFDVSEELL